MENAKAELTSFEKHRLVTGQGTWHTYDCNQKLPSLRMSDGPHGLRKQEEDALRNNDSLPSVCFPTASAIACSWDIEAAAKLAKALGTEAVKEQIAVVLGPGINIKRSPLCGRNFEYFSEDPYLAGTLATAYINALQSTGVAASLKHFAGNSQETHRQTSNSQIDERALREIYLSAFEMAVKEARPATIMASYNRLNGSYACENKMLLTDILRKEWGFEGVVVSDWGACADLPKCIEAGMDLEMPDSCNYHSPMLEEALQSGKLSEVSIDRAAGNMLHLTDRYSGSSGTLKVSDHTDLHQLAKELACESAVLLKNDGFLPLREESIILVIGDLAKTMRFQGGGSSHINTVKTPNALEALRANGVKLQFYRGYRADSDRVDQKLEKEAIDAVKAAEGETPVLFFGGLTEYTEGEGYDRKTLDLPKNQVSLVEKLHVLGAKLAFVSFGGSPFSIPFISHVHAILHMYLGGEAAGEACTQLLLGNVNPSGKLAETFPMKTEDIPCNPWFGTGSDDVEYRESIFVGYRYYDTYQRPVLFPFGHGLSYTTFRYSNLEADCDTFCGGTMTVSLDVENTGGTYGKEIVQIYVKNPACNYLRAEKELKGFTKCALGPGEKKTVRILLNNRSFSVYDRESRQFVMPSGCYEVLAAASAEDIRLTIKVNVKGKTYERNDRAELAEYFNQDFNQNKKAYFISQQQFAVLYGRELSHFDNIKKGEYTVCNSLRQLSRRSLLAGCVLVFARLSVYGMFRGRRHDDPEVMMMIEGISDGMLDTVICQSEGRLSYRLAESLVLSANGQHVKAIVKLIGGK